jgi:uncharacterized lipoprotein NlpE involved in copper resistance
MELSQLLNKEEEMAETKLVIDCSTGVQTEVELTKEEIAQRKADLKAYELEEAARLAAEAEKAELQESANAKLLALGLTPEEVAALIS